MLLQHLNDFAQTRNLLDDMAFRSKAVRWIITLDDAGNLEGKGPVETQGEGRRGQEFDCPQTTGPKNAGGVAEFIADGVTAVFGLDVDPEQPMSEQKRKERTENNHRKYEDYWAKIGQSHRETRSPLLRALLAFKPEGAQRPGFLRWGVSPDAKPTEKPAWWITRSSGEEVKLGPDNFSFRVNDQLLLEDEDIRAFWRRKHAVESETAETGAPRGPCLVTGKSNQPIALTHNPKVRGVPNAQPSGATIVSFDKDAYVSYGFEQSLNASTSIQAATGYCTALNWMLNREDHSIRLGQTSCCFWTRNHTAATNAWGALLNQADPEAVADFLTTPWSGREREFLRREQFHAVTLAGNAGRIVVRHWIQTTLETAAENLRSWFSDLALEPVRQPTGKEKMPPLALFRLACTTVRDARNLRSEVTAQLFRAALEGTTPSLTLLHPMLNRLRVDMAKYGWETLLDPRERYGETSFPKYPVHSRFALAKLILNRNRKDSVMEISQQHNADTGDAAYQCGRLLAVLAETQAKAHDYQLDGAGIAERYFGTAMTSPASVFPLLIRLNRHHLNNIRKSDKYQGHDRFLDEAIQEVATKLNPLNPFPRVLDLHSQGRFAIGFYQQKAADRAARDAAMRGKKAANQQPSTGD